MKRYAFVVELDRCIGCRGCQAACKMENKINLGSFRNSVKTVGPAGTYPDIQMYFLPAMCQQCEEPSCAQVCPTAACHKDPESGIVVIDPEQCIGCKSCETACPYKVNTFNQELRVMDKCNLCMARLEKGESPACVMNCSGGALHVGDIKDPDSEVSKLLKNAGEENIHSLRDFGNKPSTCYILKNDSWMDVLPQECSDTRRGRA